MLGKINGGYSGFRRVSSHCITVVLSDQYQKYTNVVVVVEPVA